MYVFTKLVPAWKPNIAGFAWKLTSTVSITRSKK